MAQKCVALISERYAEVEPLKQGWVDMYEQSLHDWVASRLAVEPTAIFLTQIAGDASPRQYFRVARTQKALRADESSPSVTAPHADQNDNGQTLVAARSPSSENNEAFLAVQRLLENAGLRVPSQIASDLERGFFLMEDMGDILLLSKLDSASVDAWYGQALTDLATLSTIPPSSAKLPSMDYQRTAEELAVFPEWFLGGLVGIADSGVPTGLVNELTEFLVDAFSAQLQCVVHRDFHCRNLMCLDDGALGIIDFQDAVIGPVTYDPVSLLKDCYVLWHRDDQLRWLELYRQRLKSLGLAIDESKAFQIGFDMSGLQRHLRVLGVFARLSLRDGKSAYLNDLPLVLHYVREVLALYDAIPVLKDFSEWFEADIMPKIMRQAWYAEVVTPAPLELLP